MKRGDFLKKLGIGIGASIIAPKILAEMPIKKDTKFQWEKPNSGSLFFETNGCGIIIESDIKPTNCGNMIEFEVAEGLQDFLRLNDLISIEGKYLNTENFYETFLITRKPEYSGEVGYQAFPLLSDIKVERIIPKGTIIFWGGNAFAEHPTKLFI